MRKTFYDKGDEEAALKWRPGKAEECVDTRKCKMYSWESYEEEYHEDYIRDIKVDEFVSDISSDEECNCPTCSLDSQWAVMSLSKPIRNRSWCTYKLNKVWVWSQSCLSSWMCCSMSVRECVPEFQVVGVGLPYVVNAKLFINGTERVSARFPQTLLIH